MTPNESIACPDCKTDMPVVTPELAVLNHENLSMIFGLHPIGFTCPACRSYFKPATIGAQNVQWAWMKAEPPMVQLVNPRIHLAN